MLCEVVMLRPNIVPYALSLSCVSMVCCVGLVQGPGAGPPLLPPLGGPGPDARPAMIPTLAPPGPLPHIRPPAGMMSGLMPPNLPPGAALGIPPGVGGIPPGVGGAPPNVMGMGQKEIWLEHKMPNGRVYYSNLITRQTKWEKPVDAIIQPGPPAPVGGASGNQGGGTPPSQPLLPHPPMPMAAPTGPPLVPARVWSEHATEDGRTYFYNKITMASVWERPKDFDIVLPLPVSLAGNQPLKSKEELTKKADEDDSTTKKAGEDEAEMEQGVKGEPEEGKTEDAMDTQVAATGSEQDVSQSTPRAVSCVLAVMC